jgi:hypothetical protein
MILASNQCAGRPSRLLRFGGEWRQNEAECEPDRPAFSSQVSGPPGRTRAEGGSPGRSSAYVLRRIAPCGTAGPTTTRAIARPRSSRRWAAVLLDELIQDSPGH